MILKDDLQNRLFPELKGNQEAMYSSPLNICLASLCLSIFKVNGIAEHASRIIVKMFVLFIDALLVSKAQ